MTDLIGSFLRRWLPTALILAGLGGIVVGFAADRLGLGRGPGLGGNQLAAIAVGVALLLAGAFLRTRRGRRYLDEWRPPTLERERTSTLLLLAIVFAGVAGLIEIGVLQLAFGMTFFQSNRMAPGDASVWMSPLGYAAPFLGLAALSGALGRRWAWLSSLGVTGFACAFLTLYSLLHIYETQLHAAAIWILSLGFGWQVARMAARRPAAFRKLARTGATVVGIVVLGLALGLPATRSLAERRAVAGLPGAPEGSPNVLLIILDTVRAASMSLYGYERPTTPVLDSLAATGAVFDRAIATAPWTLPTHASLFTGLYPHDFQADWSTPLEQDKRTLAEVLSERGYRTAGFTANREATGTASGLSQGFQHYDAHTASFTEFLRSSGLWRALIESRAGVAARLRFGFLDLLGRKSAEAVRREFLAWLPEDDGRPFFAFLNLYDAHSPYLPPGRYDAMFRSDGAEKSDTFDMTLHVSEVEPGRVLGWNDRYDGGIAYQDEQLRLLFGELDEKGLLENTIVVLTSDHGEEFGEHGAFTHANTMYLPALQVPLLVMFPTRVTAGLRIEEPVSVRDVAATIMDLARLESTELAGETLARHWEPQGGEGPASIPPSTLSSADSLDPAGWVVSESRGRPWRSAHHPIARGDMISLVNGPFHYIRNGDGVEELFDIERDPWEEHDLAGDPTMEATLGQFREAVVPYVRRYSGDGGG